MVVAIETGGRWSEEAAEFLWQLAQAKAREAPALLAHAAALAWVRRWTRMLGTTCAVSFTESRWLGPVITTHGVTQGRKRHPSQVSCRTIRGRTVLTDGDR